MGDNPNTQFMNENTLLKNYEVKEVKRVQDKEFEDCYFITFSVTNKKSKIKDEIIFNPNYNGCEMVNGYFDEDVLEAVEEYIKDNELF